MLSLPLKHMYSQFKTWLSVSRLSGSARYAVRNANFALPFKHVLVSHVYIIVLDFPVLSL